MPSPTTSASTFCDCSRCGCVCRGTKRVPGPELYWLNRDGGGVNVQHVSRYVMAWEPCEVEDHVRPVCDACVTAAANNPNGVAA